MDAVHVDGSVLDGEEHIKFIDVASELLEACQLFRLMFISMCENEELEKAVKDGADFEEKEERRERANTLIYERM